LAGKGTSPALKALEHMAKGIKNLYDNVDLALETLSGEDAEKASQKRIAAQRELSTWAAQLRDHLRATDINSLLEKRIKLLKEQLRIQETLSRPAEAPKTLPLFGPTISGRPHREQLAAQTRVKEIKREVEILERMLTTRLSPMMDKAKVKGVISDPTSTIYVEQVAQGYERLASLADRFGVATAAAFGVAKPAIDKVRGAVNKLGEAFKTADAKRMQAEANLRAAGVTEAEKEIARAAGLTAVELDEFLKKSEDAAVNWQVLARVADESGNAKLREVAIQGLVNKALKEGGDTAEEVAARKVAAIRKERAEILANQKAIENAENRRIEERKRIWEDLTPAAQAAVGGEAGKEAFLDWREQEIIREKTLRDYDLILKHTDKMRSSSTKMWTAAEAAALRYLKAVGSVTEQMAKAIESTIQATEKLVSDVLFDAITDNLKTFKEYMLDFLKDIARALSDLAAEMVVMGIVRGVGGNLAGVKGITPLQHGGIVNKPTVAALAEGGMSEAVVPLPNGRAIPVEFNGGKGGGDTYVTNNISPVLHVTAMDGTDAKRVLHQQMPWISQQIRKEVSIDPQQRRFYGVRGQ
jgi:hypothetical protein